MDTFRRSHSGYTLLHRKNDNLQNLDKTNTRKMNYRLKIVRCLKFVIPLSLVFGVFCYILPLFSSKTDSRGMKLSRPSVHHGHFVFNFKTSTFSLSDDVLYLHGNMTDSLRNDYPPVECKSNLTHDTTRGCYLWYNKCKLEIEVKVVQDSDVVCHKISLTSLGHDVIPYQCFTTRNIHWYGGWQTYHQRWPHEETSIPMSPFVATANNSSPFVSVAERFWVNSKGAGIVIDDSVPLHVSFNETGDRMLCFKADNTQPPFRGSALLHPSLKYTLCKGINVKAVHQYMLHRWFDTPKTTPNKMMFKKPIWSTSIKYKADINEENVGRYVMDIVHKNFNHSLLKIHDRYSSIYGDFTFGKRFPHAHQFIMLQHGSPNKFTVSVPITPFANVSSKAYKSGKQGNYWILDEHGKDVAHTKWFNGEMQMRVGMLDVTNPEAVDWFISRLKQIQDVDDYHLDAFEFYGGEPAFLPEKFKTHSPLESLSEYTSKFVNIAAQFGNMTQTHSVYKSQGHSIFVQMLQKTSSWGYDNGLKTVIPNVLQIGLLGYPYIIGSVIGGNGEMKNLADRDLYIRWLQLSAYLPVMQFSIPPWEFDEETVNISRKFMKIHDDFVTPLIMAATKSTHLSGSPLIRPVWWIAPNDPTALHLDCEFMVGDTLLVAPVLDQGARKRDIYLPVGKWKDLLNNRDIDGGRWHRHYPVKLDEIATFQLKKIPL